MTESPQKFFSGSDHISFDTRPFKPSSDDINKICEFFSIGKCKYFEKEKNVVLSHSNFFVYIETAGGKYAFKFYPTEQKQIISTEYSFNCFLINHHFSTPLMHADKNKIPYLLSNDRLATCYSFVEAIPAYQLIEKNKIIPKINTTLLSLKNHLSDFQSTASIYEADIIPNRIHALIKKSETLKPYHNMDQINVAIKEAYHAYQDCASLFTRQLTYNNAHLGNFFITNDTVYTLDLAHICKDYTLSDLSSLVCSCLSFNATEQTIKMIVQNYFTKHKLSLEYIKTLNTLIRTELIKKYLHNLENLHKADLMPQTDFVHNYKNQLSVRMNSILRHLQPKALNYLA